MKYFKIKTGDESIDFNILLENFRKVSPEDVMIYGDDITKYSSKGLGLSDLIRLTSLGFEGNIYLAQIDINPDFNYLQLFEFPSIQTPVLIDSISFSEERLRKEGIPLNISDIDTLFQMNYNQNCFIAKIYAGYSDVTQKEVDETAEALHRIGVMNVCLVPIKKNFSPASYYGFRDALFRKLKIIWYEQVELPTQNDLR